MLDEVVLGAYSEAAYQTLLADTLRHRIVTFFIAGVEYDLIVRSGPAPAGATSASFAWLFRKDTAKFLPIVYGGGSLMAALMSGGVSAATNVGRYLYLAGNTVSPTWAPTDAWGNADNTRKAVVWVRSGAFSRTFSITVTKPDGSKVVGSYKTLSASYPNLLDTSDIPVDSMAGTPPVSDYQKRVNDRVNSYNSEVTKWIGTSAADITPENIAQKLVDALIAAGLSGVTCIEGNVVIDSPAVAEVVADDGGDGTLIRAVGNQVTAPDLVSTIHYAGKVVRVRPKTSKGDDAFYLKAYPKDAGATGIVPVVWREAAGYDQHPVSIFAMATVKNGTMYLAGSPADLDTLTGEPNPVFKSNAVGDDLSCPLPNFFGKIINYLGMFQDRLVVGSGAVLSFSRPGDYFNFFRHSVLTVQDDDPWEGYALGAEDDTIRHSTTYDRNLYLHGDRFQYTVSGRQPLTPKTASIVRASSYGNATAAAPQTSGNFVFYATTSGREGREITQLHQVQSGVVADTPESYEVSQQLDLYLQGEPVQITPITKPATVLLRTTGARNRVYTYAYLDAANGSERLFDAWAHWEWAPELGDIVGQSSGTRGVNVYMLRCDGTRAWIAAERFVLDTDLSDYPYLDSLRPYASINNAASFLKPSTAGAAAAFDVSTDLAFVGTGLSNAGELTSAYPDKIGSAYAGVNFPARFTPTNPYRRDRNGQAIVSGRFTLGRISVSISNTGGVVGTVSTAQGDRKALSFSGRIMGQPANLIGKQPIVTTNVPMAIGKEVRECSYTLAALNWLPFTVTAIEYTGQAFLNSRRI